MRISDWSSDVCSSDLITVDSIAAAVGVDVVIHPRARAALEAYYTDKGGLNEQRLRMARVPAGAELIENRMSGAPGIRSEEHTSELQSLMRISYAVFCLKKKNNNALYIIN